MMIVLLTVFTMGCATVPVLKALDIATGVDEDDFTAPPPSRCRRLAHRCRRRAPPPRGRSRRPGTKQSFWFAARIQIPVAPAAPRPRARPA